MLKQRILTALWLLPLMLGMLFYAPMWLWAAFCGLIAMLTLWEYARMSGLDKLKINHYLASTLVFGVIAYAGGWQLPDLVWYGVLADCHALVAESKMEVKRRLAGLHSRLVVGDAVLVRTGLPAPSA